MDFGKLADIRRVDFSLPPDAKRNLSVLSAVPQKGAPSLYIGTTRWSDPSLKGIIYPSAAPASEFLYHYARQFNTVEMNTTHYRIPSHGMVAQWREKTPPSFRFCPKVPQSISHSPDFGAHQEATPSFLESLEAFGSQMGLSFMQLPPTFSPRRDGKKLFAYLAKWPRQLPLAVEFRHPGWFSEPAITERAHDLLQDYGLCSVITDTAGRRDVIHMQLTAKRVAIRFVGNALHPSDYQRIDAWIERIGRWLELGLEELYFFVHQPEEHLCVDLAIYMISQINKRLGQQLQLPKIVPEAKQQRLF
ncbi:MAG: DUF72 domain-containing protein [Cyclobacteriaceae bacterium]